MPSDDFGGAKRRAKGLSKSVRYNEVLFYRGSFSYILLLLGQKISFVIQRTSLVKSTFHCISRVCRCMGLTNCSLGFGRRSSSTLSLNKNVEVLAEAYPRLLLRQFELQNTFL